MRVAKGPCFTKEFFSFLSELERNNDRAWFQANKARFEEHVQGPSVRFVAEAGARLRAISPHIVADARPFGGSVMRIYRDTRFARDKRPYHTHVGIHFSHEGGRGLKESLPSYFLHLDPKACAVYAGMWRPDGPALLAIREAIMKRPADWKKATKAPIEPYGESLKRPPPGVAPDHPMVEDLKRKDFVGGMKFTRAQVRGPNFMDDFVAVCKKMDGLNAFLAKAMGVPW